MYEEVWQNVRLIQTHAKPDLHIEDMECLVISCTRLHRSVKTACDDPINLPLNDVQEAVEPFVSAAIDHCAEALGKIADSAIKMDLFQPISAEMPCSTSIVDLLRACVQAVQPLQYLLWSPSSAVKMAKRLGTVLVWYATLIQSSCKGDAAQLQVVWEEQDGVALSSTEVDAAFEREKELLQRLYVQTNNVFHANQQLANLGDKLDSLHHLLVQEGPDGWSRFVQGASGKRQWDANVEAWDGARSWEAEREAAAAVAAAAAAAEVEGEGGGESLLRPTMSRLNRGEIKDPADVTDVFLAQCQGKYRDCVDEVVNAIGVNIHRRIATTLSLSASGASLTDVDAGGDGVDLMFGWLDETVLGSAEETLLPSVFRRVIRGVHFQCICQLEALLLGEGVEGAVDKAGYEAQIDAVKAVCESVDEFFGDHGVSGGQRMLAERVEGLISTHQNNSSEALRVLSEEIQRGNSGGADDGAAGGVGGGVAGGVGGGRGVAVGLPAHVTVDDVRRILAMRSKHDSVALGVLQEQGLSGGAVLAPEGFELGAEEGVLGRFECWFPAGAIYVCTDHLLFDPKLGAFDGILDHVFEAGSVLGETQKVQVSYSEIRFLKKQKMTGVGADTCLEVGLDGEVLCFKGFRTAHASGQSARDNCLALICAQAISSCGNDLESAEAGSWPELRRMFGAPASESLIDTFSCHYVVHGVSETTHTNEGTLYVTPGYLCFHSYFFGVRNQEVIPLRDCARVEKSSYPVSTSTLLHNLISRDVSDRLPVLAVFGAEFNRCVYDGGLRSVRDAGDESSDVLRFRIRVGSPNGVRYNLAAAAALPAAG